MSPDRDMSSDDKPDAPDPDVDAAFAQIVAGWDAPDTSPVPRWPVSEDVDSSPARLPQDRGGEPGEAPADQGPPGSQVPTEAQPPASPPSLPGPPDLGPRDWAAVEVPDEGYVPPEPPPLPRGDVPLRLAWAGVLLGPLFLILAGLFWQGIGRLWLALAVLAFIGGFVALVMRLPDRDDSDDDGAVV